jgi:nucleotide-binding universal stress UspA family protein
MKILVAVDDSPESRHAIDAAFTVFGPDAHYTVCSIGPTPLVYTTGLAGGGAVTATMLGDQLDEAEAEARRVASEAGQQLPTGTDIDVATGHVGAAIADLASEHGSDVVVIGSRERTIWKRLFDPSVGRYLIDHAPCSVLVVR